MDKKILLLMLLCILFTGCSLTSVNEGIFIENISVDKVKNIVDNYSDYSDLYIIDVRTESEYKSGHIANSLNIPLNHLEEIDISKDSKIIVYCQSGRRSLEGATILNEMGYMNVFDMGGINNWTYELVN